MLKKDQYELFKAKTLEALASANIAITPEEAEQVEVADFGLGRIDEFGLQLITYVNTNRCCSKELVLMPWQICPEHRHPPINGTDGKEETFRCRKGLMYLYVGADIAGERDNIHAKIPHDKENDFTVYNEIILTPGMQYTLPPDTLHWFQAGPEGCIASEFSTQSIDEADIFTDSQIKRAPEIAKE